jgi:GNAT superfamily N-acetyltransferase
VSAHGFQIGEARAGEYPEVGRLLVRVYGALEGFPRPHEQPGYYAMLADVGSLAHRPGARLLVARAAAGDVAGAVVYFGDMAAYGSGGAATQLRDTSGIRLLGVDDAWRGHGLGRSLTQACIDLAHAAGHAQVVLHTTQAMQHAWALYERLGFRSSPDLDFLQERLQVFGFRKPLR